jgi:hypothetical protein
MIGFFKMKGEAMRLGRPIPTVILSSEMREQLQSMSRARSLPQALAQRGRIILLAADGLNNGAIPVSNFNSLLLLSRSYLQFLIVR